MSIETMTKLATTTLSANTASVTFSNIPQTYTDLRISVSGRTTGGVGDSSELGTISFSFGSTSYTYSDRFIGGNGTAAYSSANSTAATSTPIYWVNGSGSTASTFASVNIDIPNYTLNNAKNISYEAAPEYNNSTLRMMLGAISTTKTDPVTQIVLTAGQTAFAINSTFTLYGIKAIRTAVGNGGAAYGGTRTFDGTYFYHTFTSSGTLVVNDPLLVDYLVVAGGGGGGGLGGGGAGGMRCTVTATGGGGNLESKLSLLPNSYTVTVGAGGAGIAGAGGNLSNNGSNSVFSTITSTGGGGGGSYSANIDGRNGGSGGGAGTNAGAPFTSGAVGTGTANQGFAGGLGTSSQPYGGGGGGAGAVGTQGTGGDAGDGGNGVATSISGSSVTYAGGGGGGNGTIGSGGTGGGGTGGGASNSPPATSGTVNTGGGGGGSANTGTTGAGGSGVVIIRYRAIA